jgi:hypothetical protein
MAAQRANKFRPFLLWHKQLVAIFARLFGLIHRLGGVAH